MAKKISSFWSIDAPFAHPIFISSPFTNTNTYTHQDNISHKTAVKTMHKWYESVTCVERKATHSAKELSVRLSSFMFECNVTLFIIFYHLCHTHMSSAYKYKFCERIRIFVVDSTYNRTNNWINRWMKRVS